jgi:hypothetical protein
VACCCDRCNEHSSSVASGVFLILLSSFASTREGLCDSELDKHVGPMKRQNGSKERDGHDTSEVAAPPCAPKPPVRMSSSLSASLWFRSRIIIRISSIQLRATYSCHLILPYLIILTILKEYKLWSR